MATTKFHCHQVLPTVYGLNKSYTKKIAVGLENSGVGHTDFQPIIRIFTDDFVGISFTAEEWLCFREQFPDIEKYLDTDSVEKQDEQQLHSSFNIRFIRSYNDKAIELVPRDVREEEGGEPPKKKPYRPSLVFKKVTFDHLKTVSRCIDVRVKYLTNVQKNIKIIISCISKFLKGQLEKDQESQYVNFTKSDVLPLTTKFDGINAFGAEILDSAEKKFEKKMYPQIYLHAIIYG